MRVWFAELLDGVPHPLQDHDELRWINLRDRDEVLGLPWIPADLPIVEALLDRLPVPDSTGRFRALSLARAPPGAPPLAKA